MTRSDGLFDATEKVGSNSYKFQLPGDMVVSATFNIGDLSPYVEDSIEDPSDLRLNPSEEGKVDAGAFLQGPPGGDQGQGSPEQGALTCQILALFPLTSFLVCSNLFHQGGYKAGVDSCEPMCSCVIN